MPGKHKILIVDDEPAIASSLALVFARHGYESRAAHSAEKAVELLPAWKPDLAIVDVHLGHGSGPEFAMQLRERYPNCKVALFTGLLDLTDLLAQARHSGPEFKVIQKPIHPAEVLQMVAEWLSGPEEPELSTA